MVKKNTHFGKSSDLKEALEEIFRSYHDPQYLGLDPLICVHRYRKSSDIEIVGLLAAGLAYGRVEIVIRSIERVLSIMGSSPTSFVAEASFKEKCRLLGDFKHRFNDGRDIATLLQSVAGVTREYGTLERCFRAGLETSGGDLSGALELFTGVIRENGRKLAGERKSFEYLVASPAGGSAAKRMALYLRWMVRKEDGIDLGIWKSVSPSVLVMPVDTHVARIAAVSGLSKRKVADWRMAQEITSMLRTFDPEDPVKYDFSLCRAGMLHFRGAGGDLEQ